MVTIATIATAVLPYRMTCAEVKLAVQKVFPLAPRRLAAALQLSTHIIESQ